MSFADVLECTIDFRGQKLADQITHFTLISFAVIAFVSGYALQSLQTTLAVFAAGFGLTVLLVLPPWPMYNRHPVKWLPATEAKDANTQ